MKLIISLFRSLSRLGKGFLLRLFLESAVRMAISDLSNSPTRNLYGLIPTIIKHVANAIVGPLTKLFNVVQRQGNFLKLDNSIVNPIF